MTGDELIAYGFKRVVELLEEISYNTTQINMNLIDIEQQLKTANQNLSLVNSKADTIENHLFTEVGTVLAMQERLDQARADTYTTALNVIRIGQALEKEESDNDGSEDV